MSNWSASELSEPRATPQGEGARILVVDDDKLIRDLLTSYLEPLGFQVRAVASGEGMREALARDRIDLILLDIVMPGEDGFSLAREVRARSAVSIIMLTANADVIDRVAGLEGGADDYLTKPFHPREVVARIRAVLRRARAAAPAPGQGPGSAYHFAGWTLLAEARRLLAPGEREVELTTAEFDLLLAFLTHPGRVLDRNQLMDLVKGRDWAAFDRTIDQQVRRLRRKIEEDPGRPQLVKAVRGAGYVFTPAVRRG